MMSDSGPESRASSALTNSRLLGRESRPWVIGEGALSIGQTQRDVSDLGRAEQLNRFKLSLKMYEVAFVGLVLGSFGCSADEKRSGTTHASLSKCRDLSLIFLSHKGRAEMQHFPDLAHSR